MKERPILFSGPMVRAILDERKTQTRRPVKSLRRPYGHLLGPEGVAREFIAKTESIRCPLGQPGDRLWVRETWCAWNTTLENVECYELDCDIASMQEQGVTQSHITYKADPDRYADCWRPSMHMPRWASRITLEITRVWVERVQDITEEDAKKEGVSIGEDRSHSFAEHGLTYRPHKDAFRDLWQSIYGTWDANPWVWAVEFRRTK